MMTPNVPDALCHGEVIRRTIKGRPAAPLERLSTPSAGDTGDGAGQGLKLSD
jgi:hypothetical protein